MGFWLLVPGVGMGGGSGPEAVIPDLWFTAPHEQDWFTAPVDQDLFSSEGA